MAKRRKKAARRRKSARRSKRIPDTTQNIMIALVVVAIALNGL